MRGKWTSLYRALDKLGNTIDFYLSPTRNAKAAKPFLGKALNGLKDWEKPEIINTDKAPTYGIAISELKAEGKWLPRTTSHWAVDFDELKPVFSSCCWNLCCIRRLLRASC